MEPVAGNFHATEITAVCELIASPSLAQALCCGLPLSYTLRLTVKLPLIVPVSSGLVAIVRPAGRPVAFQV